jgi:SAM-dependent methyltransferase
MHRIKIRVTIPLLPRETICTETSQSIEQLKKSKEFEVRVIPIVNAYYAAAKNEGINNNRSTEKYQEVYDYVYNLIVENGVVFDEKNVSQLAGHAVGVVGGTNRCTDTSPKVSAGNFGFHDGLIIEEKMLDNKVSGLQRCDWINTGLLLIRNTAIAQMAYPWFRHEIVAFDDVSRKPHQQVTDENIGFCVNAKQSNVLVYCDTGCIIHRIGSYHPVLGRAAHTISSRQVQCAVCRWEGEKFMDVEYDDHVYADAECPRCLAHPRQRVFAKYWEKNAAVHSKGRLLHISPSPCEEKFIKRVSPAIEYVSMDIDPLIGMDNEDITGLSYSENLFDNIVCLHVLEHIPRDTAAIAEIYRVLHTSGQAVIMVPLDRYNDKTYEDPTITDPKERTKAFWHWDHVRLYGNDFQKKLEEGGFTVSMQNIADTFSPADRKKYGLGEFEPIFICRK